MRAGIVNYRMGNLASVSKAFERSGAEAVVSSEPDVLRSCDLMVLPGVGAFGAGMRNLTQGGLAELVVDWVKAGKPMVGICLGMQLLFGESEESPEKGLGLVAGRVERFDDGNGKVPHMGWNQVHAIERSELFAPFSGRSFYFVHSYYCRPELSMPGAVTDYGGDFVSAVEVGNVVGVQFHPEKSSDDGLELLKSILQRAA